MSKAAFQALPRAHTSLTRSSIRRNVHFPFYHRLSFDTKSARAFFSVTHEISNQHQITGKALNSIITFRNLSDYLRNQPPPQVLSYQRLQYRFFDNRMRKKRKRKDNPFKVLGIPEGVVLYKDAKKKFLKIAMKNHPDTISGDVSEEDKEAMRETFIRARMAFESLAEDPMDGTAILATELEDAMENFDSWFKNETGLNTPFQFDMDPETMKEVASMTEKIGGGLDRDGGMWALARMVTSAVKSGSDAATVLRLESGDVKDRGRSPDGALRRRRKR